MLTVDSVQPHPHGNYSLPDVISWLRSDKVLHDKPLVEHYDMERALAEIVRDGGPTLLCHMNAWGTVRLPKNITEQVYSVHGETKVRRCRQR